MLCAHSSAREQNSVIRILGYLDHVVRLVYQFSFQTWKQVSSLPDCKETLEAMSCIEWTQQHLLGCAENRGLNEAVLFAAFQWRMCSIQRNGLSPAPLAYSKKKSLSWNSSHPLSLVLENQEWKCQFFMFLLRKKKAEEKEISNNLNCFQPWQCPLQKFKKIYIFVAWTGPPV